MCNLSAFAIMKADGTLVEGSVTGGTAIEAAEVEGVYYVTGTSKKDELTFSNLEAGTYYIVGVASGADDTLLEQNTGRNTRIYAMSLSDLY